MFKQARRLVRIVVTLVILGVATAAGVLIWNEYLVGPWTRDAQVQAQVVSVAPQVSGRIVAVNVQDNQFVRKGDVLYQIDPFDYQTALASAEATLQGKQTNAQQMRTEAQRRQQLSTLSTSEEEKQTYTSNAEQATASYGAALASLSQARTNLARTQVKSPVNGYVTNLLVEAGDYATSGTRNISLIDSDSFWVSAYFEETKLRNIHLGDPALIALMGFNRPLRGHVVSFSRGINSSNYSPGTLGLASVNPVFTWVRLAQRIPVRIHIDAVPPGVLLAAGETATVTVGPRAAAGPHATHGLIARLFAN